MGTIFSASSHLVFFLFGACSKLILNTAADILAIVSLDDRTSRCLFCIKFDKVIFFLRSRSHEKQGY